jgi:hypothetical protein
LLRFLKEHNPYYSHIVIRPTDDIDLPDDGNVIDRLPHVWSAATEPGEPPVPGVSGPVEDSVDAAVDDLGNTFSLDELAQEQNMFVPGIAPRLSEMDVICIGMRETGASMDRRSGLFHGLRPVHLCQNTQRKACSPWHSRVCFRLVMQTSHSLVARSWICTSG